MTDPSEIVYLELDQVKRIIERITGSVHAVRDWGLVASAVERPRTDVFGVEAYPTLVTKTAALLHSLVRNHALVDGNKRTAWTSAQLMLYLNGIDMAVSVEDAVPFVEAVARGELEVDEIAKQFQRWSG